MIPSASFPESAAARPKPREPKFRALLQLDGKQWSFGPLSLSRALWFRSNVRKQFKLAALVLDGAAVRRAIEGDSFSPGQVKIKLAEGFFLTLDCQRLATELARELWTAFYLDSFCLFVGEGEPLPWREGWAECSVN